MFYKTPLQPFEPVIKTQEVEVSKYLRDNFFGAGQDSFSRPFSQSQEIFQQLLNIMPIAQGTFTRRWGYSLLCNPSAGTVRRIYSYQNETAGRRKLIYCSSTTVKISEEDGTVIRTLFSPVTIGYWGLAKYWPLSSSTTPRVCLSRDWAFFFDATPSEAQKWHDVYGLLPWGFDSPTTAPSVGAPIGGGSITLASGRNYFLVFENPTTGHFSDLSPVSASTGPLTAKNIPLSNLEISVDSQVTQKRILATLDGGDQTTLYELGVVPNSTTTFTDNISDDDLVTNNIFLNTDEFGVEHGVSNNTPPPPGIEFVTKHRGRLYGLLGETLYFTKSLDEVLSATGTVCGRWEECWPLVNTLDASSVTETGRGILSDGNTLYIGTERHIWRLDGDGPQNFSKPEVIFNEVGILNQDCWQVVFAEGRPVGMIWITPDLRVILSNFSEYHDIGTPIQDVLNTLNLSASANVWGAFYSKGSYDIFILAIPTGSNTDPDTLCIFDLRSQRWIGTWTPADTLTAGLLNITLSGTTQWLIGATSGKVYQFLSTATQDRVGDTPVSFTSLAKTGWLHLGLPSQRKALNEIEVFTNDSALTVSIEGATTIAQALSAPNSVISSAPLSISQRGQFKAYLAGSTSKDRNYRLTFTSTSTEPDFLQGFLLESIPFPF